MSPRLLSIIITLAAFLVGAAAAVLTLYPGLITGPAMTGVGRASVGGAFSLIDHTGKRVSDRDFRGRHLLVYFGFTHCPDVCPAGLQVMAAGLDKAPKAKADAVVPVFISLDPERDTTEQMALYVASFHPRLLGLTGSVEEIAAVAKAYRVFYRKVKDERSSAAYTVDHTSIIYLMGREGEFISHFTHAASPDTIAEAISRLP
jgi:protein SCO1/2